LRRRGKDVSWHPDILVMSSVTRQVILFVDDDKYWRDRVSACLAEAGFDVLAASDGSEAMRKAAGSSLGLMIVDEDLAGESGVTLTKFLRRNHPDVPTMLYTSNRHIPHQTPDMMSQAANRCLPKGSMTDLLANVAYYVR
jgi:DNA-binding response OmpR family regulator